MAKRIGIGGDVEFTRAAVGQTLHLYCGAGDHMVDVHIAARQHPDAVAKKLLASGWVMGSKLKCPEHSRRKSSEARAHKSRLLSDTAPRSAVLSHAADKILSGDFVLKTKTHDDTGPLAGQREANPNRTQRRALEKEAGYPKKPALKPAKPDVIRQAKAAEQEGKQMPELSQTPAQVSDAAKKAQRMIYLLLEEQYDESKKRYRPGWDDRKVSVESGAHINVVTKIRQEFYGPLGEPTELTELKEAIQLERDRLHERREDDDKRILALENKMSRICAANGWSNV